MNSTKSRPLSGAVAHDEAARPPSPLESREPARSHAATAPAALAAAEARHAREADYTDRAGAEKLKARIESYWRERGSDVQVILVPAAFTAALRAARYDVRSEMLNGLPRPDRKACFA